MIVSGSYKGFASCLSQHEHEPIYVGLRWNSADPAGVKISLLLGHNAENDDTHAFVHEPEFDFELARDLIGATVSQAFTRRPIGTPGFVELSLVRSAVHFRYRAGCFTIARRDVKSFLASTYERCPTRMHESDAYNLDRLALQLQYSTEV